MKLNDGKLAEAATQYRKALRIARQEGAKYEKVFELLEQSMKMGSADATYAVATWYLHGTHVAPDIVKGTNLLKRAVRMGNSSACFDLASSFERGLGVTKDTAKAFDLYLEAALRGDQSAYREVARCYWHGIGTRRNRIIADLWGKMPIRKTKE